MTCIMSFENARGRLLTNMGYLTHVNVLFRGKEARHPITNPTSMWVKVSALITFIYADILPNGKPLKPIQPFIWSSRIQTRLLWIWVCVLVFCCVHCESMFDCLHTFRLNLTHDKPEIKQNINVIWILGPDLMIGTHLLPKRKLERERSRVLFVSAWIPIIRSGPRIQIKHFIRIRYVS